LKNLLEILQLSSDYLARRGVENARREAELLLCDFLGIRKVDLYLKFDRPMEESELSELRKRLKRRALGEPNAYIHGEAEFFGCTLKITPAVLIPRQETEILVDLIAKTLEKENLPGKRLLDLCCGSGCIGLALKKMFPELDVTLSDLSKEALRIAEINAERNRLEVRLIQGDLLEPFSSEVFDYVVCNPPYVSKKEYEELSPEVRVFEPKAALLAGETGLEFYQRLKRDLPSHLTPKAKAWFEIGASQGKAVQALFTGSPWRVCRVIPDWAKRDRFISLEKE
jgi:release factor glutamine methyltransferase